MSRYPMSEIEIPESFEAPPHVPPELVRNYAFTHTFDSNILDDPFSQTVRAFDGDVPPIFYAPGLTIQREKGSWVVTRYRDIKRVYTESDTFSNEGAAGFQYLVGETWPMIPLAIDPPEHRKYRNFLDPWFSPKAVDAMEPKIRANANELIDGFSDRGACDFSYDFGRVFPVRIFLELMGLPFSKFEDFLTWEYSILHSGGDRGKVIFGVQSALDYLRTFIADTKRAPRDDLASYIVNGRIEGRPLTDDEIIGMVFFLWVGGLDTVAATLSLIFRRLALFPEVQQHLRDDPGLIPNAVEEFLRVQPIVNSSRWAKKDTELCGVKIKAGDYVTCLNMAGNFDPEEFACPRELRLDRKPIRHFTLAGGPHRCMGSHLARRELRVALEEWLRRIPPFRLQPDADRTVFPGLIAAPSLPITWAS
jgi:cytochrome P450